MSTKLRGQRLKGYDEYLLDDGTIIYHDVDSGEDVESELRRVPVGSLLLTPKQLEAHKAYKERGQNMAAQKKNWENMSILILTMVHLVTCRRLPWRGLLILPPMYVLARMSYGEQSEQGYHGKTFHLL